MKEHQYSTHIYLQKHLKSTGHLYSPAGQNKNQDGANYYQATYQRHPVYQKALSGLQASLSFALNEQILSLIHISEPTRPY